MIANKGRKGHPDPTRRDTAMTAIAISDKYTISNNYLGAPRTSCKPFDYPTGERVTVVLDGTEYERTVHERAIWRAGKPNKLVARFVIVNGVNYRVDRSANDFDWAWEGCEGFENPVYVDGKGHRIDRERDGVYVLNGIEVDGVRAQLVIHCDSFEDAGRIATEELR